MTDFLLVFLTAARTKGRSAVIFLATNLLLYFNLQRFSLDVVELRIRGSLSSLIIMDVVLYEGVQRAVDHHLISHNSALNVDHRNWMH